VQDLGDPLGLGERGVFDEAQFGRELQGNAVTRARRARSRDAD
jgi:hypothetical protein